LLELKNGLEKKLEKFAAELEVDENKLKTMFGFPADDESERYRKAGITMRSMARKEVYSDEEDEYFDRTLVKEDRVLDKEERTKKLQKAAE